VKSEDGSQSWTLPVEISGPQPAYCTFQDDVDDTADRNGPNSSQGTAEGPDDPFACDQDQFSISAVAPNGDLYIQFDNEQNLAAYELPQRYDSPEPRGGGRVLREHPAALSVTDESERARARATARPPSSSRARTRST
jgi:hypothetical protein